METDEMTLLHVRIVPRFFGSDRRVNMDNYYIFFIYLLLFLFMDPLVCVTEKNTAVGRLDARRVEHHPQGGAHGAGGQVGGKGGADRAVGAVHAANAAPDDAELLTIGVLGGLVDEADTLAEVKVGIARRGDALDLQEGGAHLLDVARALVAHKHRLGVHADGLGRRFKALLSVFLLFVRHICKGLYYTSVSLFERLAEEGLWGCGTVKQSRFGIPDAQ